MIDAVWRGVLFLGHRLLRVWWFVRRPTMHGAHVIVRRPIEAGEDWELLLVRNSYKAGVTVPCGGMRRGEPARDTAQRELREEVGIVVPAERLRAVCEIVQQYQQREDHAHYFELMLAEDEHPEVRIDRREVIWAGFASHRTAGELDLVPHLRAYLAQYAERNGARPHAPAGDANPS